VSRELATQVGSLARRSVVRTLRQPAMVIPSLLFPMLLLAVNSGGLASATRLPGFPTNSYLTFALAVSFIQGGLFGAMSAGTNIANDVETGFLSRLSLTPLRRAALLIGQLAGVVVLGLVQAGVFLVVGFAAGAHFETGVAGAGVIVLLVITMSLAFGGLGAFAALRAGNGEAVQGLFPVMFAALFLSSTALPRPLIEIDWFRAVATANPVSYMLEGIRALMIQGWDGEALALAFGLSGAIAVITLTASSLALRTRMTRT
jgi:ABC-2 type transport system permease protein